MSGDDLMTDESKEIGSSTPHVLFSAKDLVILPSLTLQGSPTFLTLLLVWVVLSCLHSGTK